MATMLLGGLWHGAAWHFVVWGGLHGLGLALQRLTTGGTVASRPAAARNPLRRAVQILLTFHLVCVLWVFFRARDLPQAWAYLQGLTGSFSAPPVDFALGALGYLLLVGLIDWPCWRRETQLPIAAAWPAWGRGAAYAALALGLSFVGETNVRPFIYFQF